MQTLIRTTSNHPDFKHLTNLFDEYLVDIDGDEKDFFAQYNQIYLENVIVCYENQIPVGCGAFKVYDSKTVEIKRMYVDSDFRGKGIASEILSELELWATELNYSQSILETSFKLKSAINLYKRFGYAITENYGQYVDVQSSVCMKKALK